MLKKEVKCFNYCINIVSVSEKKKKQWICNKKSKKKGDDGGESENASAMEFKKASESKTSKKPMKIIARQ